MSKTKRPYKTGELAEMFLRDVKIPDRPNGADQGDVLMLAGVILEVVTEFTGRLADGEDSIDIQTSMVSRLSRL